MSIKSLQTKVGVKADGELGPVTVRKVMEYFKLTPISPDIHIQTRAPGPPLIIATATPAIFPIPMVADSPDARA
jgi:hypothetical protein